MMRPKAWGGVQVGYLTLEHAHRVLKVKEKVQGRDESI